MIGFLRTLLSRGEPMLADATARDAGAIAALHAASFRRGWSEQEVEGLLVDRGVVAQRVVVGRTFAGFIMSRLAADEAEILSVAVARNCQGRGLARQLLNLHLRRLAGLGVRTVFLEVDEHNAPAIKLYGRAGFREVSRRANYYPHPGGQTAAALVLRRDIG
ncbi:MAG: ribosomal protein S18-alanine N-acetyltransferase [Pseudolabrys sp.]|nr:ribosomal protein S18-alanine N-acetyltransferase [Pseudolabrys sp.]MDP2294418.1 ribosomal protein S18-alanine N-acetyltransferase [Pseudolabrys sp.]